MDKNNEKIEGNEKLIVKKNSLKENILLVLIIVCMITLIGVIIWIFTFGNKSSTLKSNLKHENVELTYTSSGTVKSEGVYITDVSSVVDEVMPSIVAITSKTIINSGKFGPSFYGNSQYVAQGAGSGVIVAENESEIFILTNYHVVENTTELSVKFIDDTSCDASIKGVSKNNDVAIVSVSKNSLSSDTLNSIKMATLGSSDDLKVGNGIIAIGNALGYGQSVTTGVVSALNREITTNDYKSEMIQIDAAINGGNSGGALLNSKGEVVGINTAKYSSSYSSSSASIEGMGFAIPISKVKSIIDDLINGEDITNQITLGIEGYMTNSGNIVNYGLPTGFYISKIYNDSNADKSNLEIGNIITEIDNNKVSSLNDIKKVLEMKNRGDKLTLKIKYIDKKEYKEKEMTITLN